MLWNLLLAVHAFASPDPQLLKSVVESQPSCQNAVRFDDNNLYLAFGLLRRGFEEPRRPIPGFVKVAPLSDPAHPFRLVTDDGVIDTYSDGTTLYALTFTAVEVWDLATKQRLARVPTFAKAGDWEYMEQAQGFARYGDKLVIAHGRLGVSFFDLRTRRITNQLPLLRAQAPRESMAMDVAVSGKYGYVVLDSFTVANEGFGAFRGIVVLDLEQEKVVAELNGMDPGADAILADGDSLVVSFWGFPLWKYAISDFRSDRALPNPRARQWNFPLKGHPIGKPVVDAANYYTCFREAGAKPGEASIFHPVALDRKALGM